MGDLVIGYHNNAENAWNSDVSHKYLEKGGNTIKTWPTGTLLAFSGFQQCLITQNLSKVTVGPCEFYYCWNDGHWCFGVKIQSYFQEVGIGDRPTWQVMSDQNIGSSTISWEDNGSSPGNSYQWPSSIGYSIMATPTSTHQGLNVNVIINNGG
jgi:hypothetical protein